MGNRSNIKIVEENGGTFYFYTHWGTDEDTKRAVVRALQDLPGRWRDESYLARGIFCRLVEGQEMTETGFGISTWPAGDAGYPLVTVNIKDQTVKHGRKKPVSFMDFMEKEMSTK